MGDVGGDVVVPALELYSCYRMRLLTAFLAPLSGGLESTAAAGASTAQTSSNISQISKDFTLQQPAGSATPTRDKQLILSSQGSHYPLLVEDWREVMRGE